MKKFLYFALSLAAAVGFTSCEDKESEVPMVENGVNSYVGSLVVTNTTDTTTTPYTKSDVEFEFDDETNTLTMWGVAFAEAMPVSVDIVIADVPEVSEGVYKTDSIKATLESGEPAPSFIGDLTDVAIKETNDALDVEFSVDVTMMMGATTSYSFTYVGTEKE